MSTFTELVIYLSFVYTNSEIKIAGIKNLNL